MEALVRIEHLKLCHRENNEAFEKYVTRFRTLVSKMRDTPEMKEVIKICSMNAGPAAYFLTGASCSTFDELFDRVISFDELERNKASYKASGASTNTMYDKGRDYQNRRSRSPSKELNAARNDGGRNSPSRRETKTWRDIRDYTFDI